MDPKYEELYRFTTEQLDREQERFNRVDQKASWYLSALTVVIAATGYFSNWATDHLLPPQSTLEWVMLIITIALMVVLVGAWLTLFKVMRTHSISKMPLNEEVLLFYETNTLLNIYFALARGNMLAYRENVAITNAKSRALTWAYRLLVAAVFILVAFTVVYAISACIDAPTQQLETSMSADDNHVIPSGAGHNSGLPKGPNPPPENEKPDPSIKPPTYEHLTEGYDPKAIQKRGGGQQGSTEEK